MINQTEAQEQAHLETTRHRLDAALARIDARLREYAEDVQAQKTYLWENRADMDHAEKNSTRESVYQSVFTGEAALATRKRLQKLVHSLKHGPKRWPPERAFSGSVGALSGLRLSPVVEKARSRLWNGLIDRYHYLGYSPLPGAQMRYLIESEQGLLGALGFGAAAWKVAARDRWIGWERETRERHLGRVLNNARFLVLPWIRVRNLASRVLALAARQVGEDFAERYGERPVLLETFVETPRFRGTCYRAANWQHLGCTQGRGKCDVAHRAALARKDIYVYPLSADFRRALGVGV